MVKEWNWICCIGWWGISGQLSEGIMGVHNWEEASCSQTVCLMPVTSVTCNQPATLTSVSSVVSVSWTESVVILLNLTLCLSRILVEIETPPLSQGQATFHVYTNSWAKGQSSQLVQTLHWDCTDVRPALNIYNSWPLTRYLQEDESFMKFPATCSLCSCRSRRLGALASVS